MNFCFFLFYFVGNIIRQTENDGAQTIYSYDDLYRLTEVTYPKEKIEQIRNQEYTPPRNQISLPDPHEEESDGDEQDKKQPGESSGKQKERNVAQKKTGDSSKSKEGKDVVREDSSESTESLKQNEEVLVQPGNRLRVQQASGFIREETTQALSDSDFENQELKTDQEINGADGSIDEEALSEELKPGENRFVAFVKETTAKVIKWVKGAWNWLRNLFGFGAWKKIDYNVETEANFIERAPTERGQGNGQNEENSSNRSQGNQGQNESSSSKEGNQRESESNPPKQGKEKSDKPKQGTSWDDFYKGDFVAYPIEPDYMLDPAQTVRYEYDEVGNRIKQEIDGVITDYQYNESHQLLQAGEDTFIYDANGNVMERTTEHGKVKYEYTTDNRLKGVYYPDETEVEYEYDAFRRKVSRTEVFYETLPDSSQAANPGRGRGIDNALGHGQGEQKGLHKRFKEHTSEEETHYFYDGMNVLKEYGENGQPLAQYYMGGGEMLAREMFGFHGRKQAGYEGNIRTRGGLMYYHTDAVGNVMDVTDRIGEVVMKYRYDAFGNLFTNMAAPYNQVGYTGKAYDAKASLVDLSARWYSPAQGRFTTADPFRGWQDMPLSQNRYTYVHNNPVNHTDPLGYHVGWSGQTLRQGDRGPFVSDLQRMLTNVNVSPGSIDGIYGPLTEGAVRSFQSAANIQVDGVAVHKHIMPCLTLEKHLVIKPWVPC